MFKTSKWRILRRDLSFHSKNIDQTQELKPLDLFKDRNFFNWLFQSFACFCLNGFVLNKIMKYLTATKPHLLETSLDTKKWQFGDVGKLFLARIWWSVHRWYVVYSTRRLITNVPVEMCGGVVKNWVQTIDRS